MSMREKFMKKGGITKLHSERISDDPREGYEEIARGPTDNVKSKNGYPNENPPKKNKDNDGR